MYKSLIGASALLFVLTGCASTGGSDSAAMKSTEPAKVAKPAMPMLSDDAKKALSEAEAAAKTAKAKSALWMPADEALQKAQEAANAGNSEVVIKETGKAMELIKLGEEQMDYASTNKF
jgi:hypothetical protein